MIQALEVVKERILRGTTTDADADILNAAIEHIEIMEAQLVSLPEPALLETGEEIGHSVMIEHANIYINTKENV